MRGRRGRSDAPIPGPTDGEPPSRCPPHAPGSCALCADEGVEAVVLSRRAGDPDAAVVRIEGVKREVDVALVPDAAPGDRLVVHLGFAIGRIEETGRGDGPDRKDAPVPDPR